jgi:hypothetical protein
MARRKISIEINEWQHQEALALAEALGKTLEELSGEILSNALASEMANVKNITPLKQPCSPEESAKGFL